MSGKLQIILDVEWTQLEEKLGARVQYVDLKTDKFTCRGIRQYHDTWPEYTYTDYYKQSQANMIFKRVMGVES